MCITIIARFYGRYTTMVNLKIYYKQSLGFTFYFGIFIIIGLLGYSIYQFLNDKIMAAVIDIILAIVIIFTSYINFKNRHKLIEREVSVEKYEEIK